MNGWTISPWMMDVINTTSLVILIYFSALQLVLFGS